MVGVAPILASAAGTAGAFLGCYERLLGMGADKAGIRRGSDEGG